MIYRCASGLLMLAFAAFSSSAVHAQFAPPAGTNPLNVITPMNASAGAGITVAVGGSIKYTITASDADTYQYAVAPFEKVLVPDITLSLFPKSLTSMSGGPSVARLGSDSTGKLTWEVIATAVNSPGVYIDTWTVTNPNSIVALQDLPIDVQQHVTVTKPVVGPPNPVGLLNSSFYMTANLASLSERPVFAAFVFANAPNFSR